MERLDQKINSHGTNSDSPDWISLAGNLTCEIKSSVLHKQMCTYSPSALTHGRGFHLMC